MMRRRRARFDLIRRRFVDRLRLLLSWWLTGVVRCVGRNRGRIGLNRVRVGWFARAGRGCCRFQNRMIGRLEFLATFVRLFDDFARVLERYRPEQNGCGTERGQVMMVMMMIMVMWDWRRCVAWLGKMLTAILMRMVVMVVMSVWRACFFGRLLIDDCGRRGTAVFRYLLLLIILTGVFTFSDQNFKFSYLFKTRKLFKIINNNIFLYI